MEGEITRVRACDAGAPPSPATALGLRDDSHRISKLVKKPKIRIIHVFAPEIINTDAANFRDLVQRLTGNPAAAGGRRKKAAAEVKMICSEGIKLEEEVVVDLCLGENSSSTTSSFSSGVDDGGALFGGDLDGFIQGLSDLPRGPLCSSHMELFGGTNTRFLVGKREQKNKKRV